MNWFTLCSHATNLSIDTDATRQSFSRPLRRATRPRNSADCRPMRIGAVLILCYPDYDGLRVVFTERASTLRDHAGQISFPGGKQDYGETLQETALRETEEEIGIPTSSIQLCGQLQSLYIEPSHFEITPIVGYIPHQPVFVPNTAEVEKVHTITMAQLLAPKTKTQIPKQFGSVTVAVPAYKTATTTIWGATAILLHEWVERYRQTTVG